MESGQLIKKAAFEIGFILQAIIDYDGQTRGPKNASSSLSLSLTAARCYLSHFQNN